MKLFEMEGFLRGKCLPGDMKVNETNAEYLVRKFAESEARCAALAAEVYDLKHPGTYLPSKCETPALDAFLAEVRAQGVEMFAAVLRRKGDDAFFDAIAEAQANAADQFAAQLRQEAAQ
ncbi:hypothetical protein [Enterobacter roggenkampii]|uniref:hypothetical protein n=1 Tax=Enterobacter roggenkampii TaxID=1812935 RepID=UPI0039C282C3